MAVSDQLKIIERKIRGIRAQYDLNREAAKISALSSGDLDKYKYLSGEDLTKFAWKNQIWNFTIGYGV